MTSRVVSSYTSLNDDSASDYAEERGAEGENEEGERYEWTPLMQGKYVRLDAKGADYCMILPRGKSVGGKVDEEMMIKKSDYTSFFKNMTREDEEAFIFGTAEQICMKELQRKVRTKMIASLKQSGIRVDGYTSIDEDEVFLVLTIKKDSQVTKDIASTLYLRLPILDEYGKKVDATRRYPMVNMENKPVPLYLPYDGASYFKPFSKTHEIRIIERTIHQRFYKKSLREYGVVSEFFPADTNKDLVRMSKSWASLWRLFVPPMGSFDEDEIRKYYGEYVAFFFKWYATYIWCLAPLAAFSCLVYFRRLQILGFSLDTQHQITIGWTVLVIIWAASFNKHAERMLVRSSQRWGMTNIELTEMSRPGYNEDLEGTNRLMFQHSFVYICVVAYIGFFFLCLWGVIALLEGTRESLATTALITILGVLWSSYFAPKLVELQNHRTEVRQERGRVIVVAPVRLILALVPFLQLAFLRKYTHTICSSSLEEVAVLLYNSTSEVANWPRGYTPRFNSDGSVAHLTDLTFLEKYHYQDSSGGTCIFGCYPVHCFSDDTGLHCDTNCTHQLEQSLTYYYFTHVATTLGFVVIAILLSHWEWFKESRQAKRKGRKEVYTFMQLQAKCFPYEYGSWGGSREEDFMELAIRYAMLTCFSAQVPYLALPSLLSNIVEYRLYAYRMVAVTRRTSPFPSEGIGIWQFVFTSISRLAIVVNIGLLVFFQNPMQEWEPKTALAGFIILEHIGLGISTLVENLVKGVPDDVRLISEFNMHISNVILREKLDKLDIKNAGDVDQLLDFDISLSPGIEPRGERPGFIGAFAGSLCAPEEDDDSSSDDHDEI